MLTPTSCSTCQNPLKSDEHYCPKCGAKIVTAIEPALTPSTTIKDAQKAKTTLFLCLVLGLLGFHRFYVGKIGTGLLMLVTVGGLGLWTLFDLINIVSNKFEDAKGRPLILIQNPSPYKKVTLVVTSITLWVAYCLSSFIALVFYMTSGVTDAVRNQLNALQSGHIDKAYAYTAKDFQKAVTLEQFKAFLAQYPSLKNNKSVFFNERKIDNNTGYARGTLTAKDGAQTPVEYRLIKEDGAWKILNIQVMPTGAGIEIKDEGVTSEH